MEATATSKTRDPVLGIALGLFLPTVTTIFGAWLGSLAGFGVGLTAALVIALRSRGRINAYAVAVTIAAAYPIYTVVFPQ